MDCTDADNSVLSFVRQNQDCSRRVAVVMNLTPVPRYNYRIGLPNAGFWKEVLNTDADLYGGGNVGNFGGVQAQQDYAWHNQPHSAELNLPPLGVVAIRAESL